MLITQNNKQTNKQTKTPKKHTQADMLDPAARAAAKARADAEGEEVKGEEAGALGMEGPSRLVRELQVRCCFGLCVRVYMCIYIHTY
jgi:hypothetical protein